MGPTSTCPRENNQRPICTAIPPWECEYRAMALLTSCRLGGDIAEDDPDEDSEGDEDEGDDMVQ